MTIRLPEQNHVILVGRLTRDPDVRFTQKGQSVCKFDIAVNRRYKDAVSNEWKDDTTYVPVLVWGPQAERCKEKLKKGSPVHVEGRLATSEWVDKNGQKHKSMQVVARRVQFLAAAPAAAPGERSSSEESSSAPEEASAEVADDVPF